PSLYTLFPYTTLFRSRWKILTSVVISALDDVEVLERVLHQHVVQPTGRRRDAGPDLEPSLPAARAAFLRLDDDDAVAGARAIDRDRKSTRLNSSHGSS